MSSAENAQNMESESTEQSPPLFAEAKGPEVAPKVPETKLGVGIKFMENASLSSLLAYDSDESTSSDGTDTNLSKDTFKTDFRRATVEFSSSSDDDTETDFEDEEEISISVPKSPENKGAIKKEKTPKSNGELTLDDLDPVDLSMLNINVETENFIPMGSVLGVVDRLVTIKALPDTPAYDLETLFFIDEGKRPMGFVFDVLGQVSEPIYTVRFNTNEDIQNLGIKAGTKVYVAPNSEHTQYVFLKQLLKIRGSDASWLGDNEVPPDFVDFSDDESECYHRYGTKGAQPHLKRTHSGEEHKKFESTMNRRNALNTKFNKCMDLYKEIRVAKGRQPRAPQSLPVVEVPPFDPTVPPPAFATPFTSPGPSVLRVEPNFTYVPPYTYQQAYQPNRTTAPYYRDPGPSHQ